MTPNYEILVRLSEATHQVRENPTVETAFLLREVVDELKESVHLNVATQGAALTVAILIG
jgi:hypothetical protein